MGRKLMIIAATLALFACQNEPQAPPMSDEKAVEMVNEANSKPPPVELLKPQIIGAPDIEAHSLYGAGCAFAPGNSMGAIFMSLDGVGYLKLEGEIIMLASDSGANTPGTSKFDGKEVSVQMIADGPRLKPLQEESGRQQGQLIITDAQKREVYADRGTVQCGA